MTRVDAGNAKEYDPFVLLQRGVFVERPPVCTVMECICRLLNTDPESVTREMGTIIIDNAVVDDPESAPIHSAASLVLSGAMPGLVGAMLRSGSPYKAMRATMKPTRNGDEEKPMLEIKLFNSVLENHVEDIVDHGFWIENRQE